MDQESVKQPTKFFGLSKNVLGMGAVSFLNDLSSDMIFPFIPIFLTSVLGASAVFVGIVEGIADATASILKIVSGRISDSLRRRKPLVEFGYGLSAVAKPLLAAAAAPWHVLVVRFLDRTGKGIRDAPRDALLSVSSPRDGLGRAFGFHRGADTMGAALGPLIAFAVLPMIHNNLRVLFLFSFVASFLALLILAGFVREVKDGAAPPPPSERFSIRRLGFPFLVFLFVSSIFALSRSSEAFLLLRAEEAGVAIASLPIIYFVSNMSAALAATPVGMLSDVIGHRTTFMIGMFIFSVTSSLFALTDSVSTVWILFAAYGLYQAFTEGVGRAVVADLVEERWRGAAYGVYSACTGIALLPAGIIFGYLWDRYGWNVSFLYSSLLAFLAFFLFVIFRIVFRKRTAQSEAP
jgi:MFS family permease